MKYKIYKKSKSAMQSGINNTKKWCLEPLNITPKKINSIFNWTGVVGTQDQIKILFNTIDEAMEDSMGKRLIEMAGRKAADRDALIPTAGNRRLFSQSNNPWVRFAGSFLSWAQAKTSQTNALLARVEQGDHALFLRILASMTLYYPIREAQIGLSSNKKYKESVAEEDYLEKIAETFAFSGNGNLWVEKARNMAKYDSTFAESVAPVVGFTEDMFEIITTPVKLMTDDEANTLLEVIGETTKEVSEVTPIVREVVPFVEQAFEEEDKSDLKRGYSKGGIVEGEDNVPFTKEDPADRINPYTGEPYQEQMSRLGFQEGGPVLPVLTFADGNSRKLTSKEFDNMVAINEYLKGKGYRKEARAGILGNIHIETGGSFNSNQIENAQDKKLGYGIFQLTNKKKDYDKWMSERGFEEDKINNMAAQLEYMHDTIQTGREIGGGNANTLQKSFNEKSAEEIALDFSNIWEKPGVPHNEQRVKATSTIFNFLD